MANGGAARTAAALRADYDGRDILVLLRWLSAEICCAPGPLPWRAGFWRMLFLAGAVRH